MEDDRSTVALLTSEDRSPSRSCTAAFRIWAWGSQPTAPFATVLDDIFAALCGGLVVAPTPVAGHSNTAPLPNGSASAISADTLISVCIPTFNESGSIAATVATALADPHVEVIVADGGSTDGTAEAAAAAGATVVSGASGRAACQNAAAAVARGELLLFLHGDSLLPAGYSQHVRASLREPAVALTAFRLALAPRLPLLWCVACGANLRSTLGGMPYGDQAFAMRRETYEALGGFPHVALMEEVDLVRHVHRRGGEVRILPESVVSSSRRWALHGVLGATLLNQLVLLGRRVGVPAERLRLWYYGRRGTKSY